MTKIPADIKPMLATLVREPFNRPGWVYEEKYDGDRILAYKEADRIRLMTRNGIDRKDAFPHIVTAVRNLRATNLLLDGEIVVFDRKYVSRFQLLQQRKGEPVYAVFDCLFREGKDLRSEPLSARRATLEKTLDTGTYLMLARRLAKNGLEAFRTANRRGYEGLLAKDSSSTYRAGRSAAWLKVKVHQEDEFVIVGFTEPEGSRKYFGALLPAAYKGTKFKLRYFGGSEAGRGFGLVIATGPNEFIGAGSGFRVSFVPKTPGPEQAGIGWVEEGTFSGGAWVLGRRLNGDENDQGRFWRFAPQAVEIERARVYRY